VGDVVWWEIETPAPERFQEFHGRLWGWTFEAAFGGTELDADYWLIKSGGTSIGGLRRSETGAEPHPGVRLYLEVDDLEATLARVTALGGRIERDRVALGGADRWFAVVRDPGEISFGLWTPNAASS
jgi:predicted enzyme related to lactoylglutathione lyase